MKKRQTKRRVSMPLVESQLALSLIGDLSEEVKQLTSIVTDLQAKVKRLSLKEDYEFKEFIKQNEAPKHFGLITIPGNRTTIGDDTNKCRTTTDISGNMVCGTLDPNFNLKLGNNTITYNTTNVPMTLTSTDCVQRHLVSTSESWKDASPKFDNNELTPTLIQMTIFDRKLPDGEVQRIGKWVDLNGDVFYTDFSGCTWMSQDEFDNLLAEDKIEKVYRPGYLFREKPKDVMVEEFTFGPDGKFYVGSDHPDAQSITRKLLLRDKERNRLMNQANRDVNEELEGTDSNLKVVDSDGNEIDNKVETIATKSHEITEIEPTEKGLIVKLSDNFKSMFGGLGSNSSYEKTIPIDTENPNGTVLKDSPKKELKSNWNKVSKEFIGTLNSILNSESNVINNTIPNKFQCIKPALANKIKENNIVYINSIYENEYEYLVDARALVLIN